MINKQGYECQIKCPADKIYAMFKHDILDIPNAMPESFKSLKVLEGDGKTVGTIRLWSYVLVHDPKVYTVKEQLEELDDENRCITFRILEGDVMEYYKSLTNRLSFTPTIDGGSLVKWVLEFEKKYDHIPHPHLHVDLLALASSHFDAFLNKPCKVIHKEGYESKIKYPADKFYNMFKYDILDLPKVMPESYKSIKVLKGDGKSIGTIRLWTYVLPSDPNKVLTLKDQLEELDDENRRITFRILEGDVMVDYKSFAIKLLVTPTSDGQSLVKWVLEFEKKHNQSPLPHTHLDLLASVSSHFDALHNKPAKVIHKEEYESKIKYPADKFYDIFKYDILDLPKVMPESFKNIKVLKGDGKSIGTIRLWTYVLGDDPNKVLTLKDQLEELDDENRRITFRVLEGDVLVDYKSFALKLSVTPTSDGQSLVKWVLEFEKKHNQSPLPHTILDLWASVSSHFDTFHNKQAKVIHTEEYESKIKYPADKFYDTFKYDILDLPKAMPESFKSVKVIKGDGKSIGTIRLWTYALGDDPNKVLTAKELLEELNDKNRHITFRVLEGDVTVDYKSFAVKLSYCI